MSWYFIYSSSRIKTSSGFSKTMVSAFYPTYPPPIVWKTKFPCLSYVCSVCFSHKLLLLSFSSASPQLLIYLEAASLTQHIVLSLLGTGTEHVQQVWCPRNYKSLYINTMSDGESKTVEYRTHLSLGWDICPALINMCSQCSGEWKSLPRMVRHFQRQILACLGNTEYRNFCAKNWRFASAQNWASSPKFM